MLAERDGRILSMNAREGERVTKGAVLAQFNDDDLQAQLRQAEIDVRRLQVEEQQFEALVRLNRSELDRELSLAKAGVSSQADVERARYKLEQATHEYEKTKLATEGARSRVQSTKIEAQKSIVRSPLAGVITHRYITLGTSVSKNEKLFEVAILSPLEVKFQLPQSERNRVSTGQLVELSLASSDQIIAKARIRRLDTIADPTSNTLGFLADVIGGGELTPGTAVNVHLPRSVVDPAYWVPRTAFAPNADLRKGVATTLFVAHSGKAVARTVMVSAIEGDQVAVTSGLEKGDQVILVPPRGLKDGDVVEINPS